VSPPSVFLASASHRHLTAARDASRHVRDRRSATGAGKKVALLGQDVGVGAQRGADVGVSDGLADGLDVRTVRQGVRGEGVAHIAVDAASGRVYAYSFGSKTLMMVCAAGFRATHVIP
jgi:hypothetical protein